MEKYKIDHGVYIRTGTKNMITDIERIRQQIRIGDIVSYPCETVDYRDPALFNKQWTDMRIIGIYPHFAIAERISRRRGAKRCTITYAEMLSDPRILKSSTERR